MLAQCAVNAELAYIHRGFSVNGKNGGLKRVRDLYFFADGLNARGKRTVTVKFISGKRRDQDRPVRPAFLVKYETICRGSRRSGLRKRSHTAGHRDTREKIITSVYEKISVLKLSREERQDEFGVIFDEFLLDLAAEHIHGKRHAVKVIHDRDHLRTHLRVGHGRNGDHASVRREIAFVNDRGTAAAEDHGLRDEFFYKTRKFHRLIRQVDRRMNANEDITLLSRKIQLL